MSDDERLYITRKDEGRGLIAIEYCKEQTVRGLEVYVHGSGEILLKAAREDSVDDLEAARVLKEEKRLQVF